MAAEPAPVPGEMAAEPAPPTPALGGLSPRQSSVVLPPLQTITQQFEEALQKIIGSGTVEEDGAGPGEEAAAQWYGDECNAALFDAAIAIVRQQPALVDHPAPGTARNLLWCACRDCNSRVVKDLLSGNPPANVHALDEGANGCAEIPVLACAVQEDVPTALVCAELLLAAGCDVDQCADTAIGGNNALMVAVSFGHMSLARLLIETGKANVNIANDIDLQTPLHLAAQVGSPDLLTLLLANGARASMADEENMRVLHHIIEFGMDSDRDECLALLETLRLHIRPDDLNSVLESGLNALGMAKQAHLQHVVDYLLEFDGLALNLHHRLPTCRFEEPVNIFVSAKENILYVYNLTGVCKQSRVKARDAGLHRAASLSMRQRRSISQVFPADEQHDSHDSGSENTDDTASVEDAKEDEILQAFSLRSNHNFDDDDLGLDALSEARLSEDAAGGDLDQQLPSNEVIDNVSHVSHSVRRSSTLDQHLDQATRASGERPTEGPIKACSEGPQGKVVSIHAIEYPLVLSITVYGKATVWNVKAGIYTNKYNLFTQHTPSSNRQGTFKYSKHMLHCAEISPSGNLLATGMATCGSVYVFSSKFDDDSGYDRYCDPVLLQGHVSIVSCVRFRDENTIISASHDASLIVWDLATKGVKQRVSSGSPSAPLQPLSMEYQFCAPINVFSCVETTDGLILAVATASSTQSLWNVNVDDPIGCPVVIGNHKSGAIAVTFIEEGMRDTETDPLPDYENLKIISSGMDYSVFASPCRMINAEEAEMLLNMKESEEQSRASPGGTARQRLGFQSRTLRTPSIKAPLRWTGSSEEWVTSISYSRLWAMMIVGDHTGQMLCLSMPENQPPVPIKRLGGQHGQIRHMGVGVGKKGESLWLFTNDTLVITPWEILTGNPIAAFPTHPDRVRFHLQGHRFREMAVSPKRNTNTGSYIFVVCEAQTKQSIFKLKWKEATAQEQKKGITGLTWECKPVALNLDPPMARVAGLQFSQSGEKLAVAEGGGTPNTNHRLLILDGNNGTSLCEIKIVESKIATMSFSNDDCYLAVGPKGHHFSIHDLASIERDHAKRIETIASASSGKGDIEKKGGQSLKRGTPMMKATYRGGGETNKYSSRGGQHATWFFEDVECSSVEFAPDGVLLYAAVEYQNDEEEEKRYAVQIWNVPENRRDGQLLGHKGCITRIRLTADGKFLFSASADRYICIWDTRSRECVCKLNEHQKPVEAMLVMGNQLVSASFNLKVRNWEHLLKRRVHTVDSWNDTHSSIDFWTNKNINIILARSGFIIVMTEACQYIAMAAILGTQFLKLDPDDPATPALNWIYQGVSGFYGSLVRAGDFGQESDSAGTVFWTRYWLCVGYIVFSFSALVCQESVENTRLLNPADPWSDTLFLFLTLFFQTLPRILYLLITMTMADMFACIPSGLHPDYNTTQFNATHGASTYVLRVAPDFVCYTSTHITYVVGTVLALFVHLVLVRRLESAGYDLEYIEVRFPNVCDASADKAAVNTDMPQQPYEFKDPVRHNIPTLYVKTALLALEAFSILIANVSVQLLMASLLVVACGFPIITLHSFPFCDTDSTFVALNTERAPPTRFPTIGANRVKLATDVVIVWAFVAPAAVAVADAPVASTTVACALGGVISGLLCYFCLHHLNDLSWGLTTKQATTIASGTEACKESSRLERQ